MHKTNHEAIGPEVSNALQSAFEFYNAELFAGELPGCAVIVHRHRGALGYFWPNRWLHTAGRAAHEIAIHPDHILDRGLVESLSTLVHEMCHLQRQITGKPPRGGYHCKAWGVMMDKVGLIPTSTGYPGGKRTGQKVTHMIVDGGPFALATEKLLAAGFKLEWCTKAEPAKEKSKSGKRIKYECPDCSTSVWGKAGLSILCKPCGVQMESDETEDGDDE